MKNIEHEIRVIERESDTKITQADIDALREALLPGARRAAARKDSAASNDDGKQAA